MFSFSDKDLLDYATKEDVALYCNAYDLFRHYLGDFKLGKPIISPLQAEDNPSFAVFSRGGQVFYNDFRLGGGDIIQFVRLKFGLSYQDAINKIINDSGLDDKFKTGLIAPAKRVIAHEKIITDSKPEIRIKSRKSTSKDMVFWKQFHISRDTLNKYCVTPLSYFFVNNKIIKPQGLCYAFKEFKDGQWSYTIYQPYSDKYKWLKTHDASVFYGWEQLPAIGDTLIITKSLKDIMTIDSLTGIPVTALQSEKVKPKKQVVEELSRRFNRIYLLYDNDYANEENGKPNYGREFGKEIAEEFGLIQIEIPSLIAEGYGAKDISDLAKNAGPSYVYQMLKGDINNYKI